MQVENAGLENAEAERQQISIAKLDTTTFSVDTFRSAGNILRPERTTVTTKKFE